MHKYMKKNKSQQRKGFTLIELIVSVGIFSIVVSAFATVTFNSFRANQQASLKFTAAQLAQEGVELIINKRNNISACQTDPGSTSCPDEWWEYIVPSSGATIDVYIDSENISTLQATGTLEEISGTLEDYRLCITQNNKNAQCGRYPGTEIPISGNMIRYVTLEHIAQNETGNRAQIGHIKVTSTVEWDGGELELVTFLYKYTS